MNDSQKSRLTLVAGKHVSSFAVSTKEDIKIDSVGTNLGYKPEVLDASSSKGSPRHASPSQVSVKIFPFWVKLLRTYNKMPTELSQCEAGERKGRM